MGHKPALPTKPHPGQHAACTRHPIKPQTNTTTHPINALTHPSFTHPRVRRRQLTSVRDAQANGFLWATFTLPFLGHCGRVLDTTRSRSSPLMSLCVLAYCRRGSCGVQTSPTGGGQVHSKALATPALEETLAAKRCMNRAARARAHDTAISTSQSAPRVLSTGRREVGIPPGHCQVMDLERDQLRRSQIDTNIRQALGLKSK